MTPPPPPTPIPRRTATHLSPPRRACANAGRSPPRRSRAQPGEQVECALERAGLRRKQREVAHGDRGREAVVERLRDPQAGVDAVPAEALDGELVDAQGARMVQPEQRPRPEVPRAQL